MTYITDKYDNLVKVTRPVAAENFVATIAGNVDNDEISDDEFRQFIRNTLPVVRYTGAEE